MTQLIVVASHMVLSKLFHLTFGIHYCSKPLICMIVDCMKAGLGLPDADAWHIIETIAEKNNIGYKQFVSMELLLHISAPSPSFIVLVKLLSKSVLSCD